MSSFPPMQASGTAVSRHQGLALADGISMLRLPLALAFVLSDDLALRVGFLVLAAASDFGDGWVARRWGGSRLGVLLDPITDKIFMAAAFGVVLWLGALTWYAVVAVLIRDIVATVAFAVTALRGRRTAVAARAGGKVVTVLQLLTVMLCLFNHPLRIALAWLTAGAALYAIYDYYRPFIRELNTP